MPYMHPVGMVGTPLSHPWVWWVHPCHTRGLGGICLSYTRGLGGICLSYTTWVYHPGIPLLPTHHPGYTIIPLAHAVRPCCHCWPAGRCV